MDGKFLQDAAKKGATASRASDGATRLDFPRAFRLMRRAEYDASIAKGAVGAAASSRYFFVPMASTAAGSAGALKRRWVTRSGATVSGDAYAK